MKIISTGDSEKLAKLLVLVAAALGLEGCACINDMPGDNYTCTAHQKLYKIARGGAIE